MKKKPWLFIDFDNTMMATEQYAIPSLISRFNQLYEQKIGHPLTQEVFITHFHGQTRESLCQRLSEHFGVQVDYAELFAHRERLMMAHLQALPQGVPMAPFLIEVLSDFSSQGVGLALVSNNPIQRALTAMRYASNGQGEVLARLLGTSFFEAGDIQKPAPEVYCRAMEQVGALPQESIAIEDSVSGVMAAVAAGLTTYGFVGFADNPQQASVQLLEKGCTAVFDSWQQLPNLIVTLGFM